MPEKDKYIIRFVNFMNDEDELIEEVASQKGFQVNIPRKIDSLLSGFDLSNTDVIIIDQIGPGDLALDLCRSIRSKYYSAYISMILLSEDKNPERMKASYDSGINEYLKKPVHKEEFMYKCKFLAEYTHVQRELNASRKANTIFLSNLSHEIRTPMNGIVGMIDILKQTHLDKEQSEYLDIIEGSGENLLHIINDILDFSKIAAGEIEFERSDFNMGKQIEDLKKLMSFKARERGLYFKCEVDKEIPALLRGDAVRLKQILINLCNNAVKFTPKGGVTVIAKRMEAQFKDRVKVKFEIIDTGIGIDKESGSKLLSSFSQIDSNSTRKYGGTGLGLAISQELTKMLGGKMGFESEPGKGSTFWFIMDFEEVISKSALVFDDEKVVPLVSDLNILVAEDNMINQKVAKINFEKLGHHVVIAENGIKALEHFNQKYFDIVFMDAQMPLMDGIEAAKNIRLQEKSIKKTPIILMTNTLQSIPEELNKLGISDCINKPFKIDQLIKILNKFADENAAIN